MMDESTPSKSTVEPAQSIPAAASELNNLLQIVSGTVAMLENIWEGQPEAKKYFDMLRTSVDRAAKVTAEMVRQVGGTEQKNLLHPALRVYDKATPAPQPPAKSRCILVVDDEPMALVLPNTS